jgi:hypothetical protein
MAYSEDSRLPHTQVHDMGGPLQLPSAVRELIGYAFSGTLGLDQLLARVVDLATEMASLTNVSWNQLGQWLRQVEGLRRAA